MELDTADHRRSSGVTSGLHRMLTAGLAAEAMDLIERMLEKFGLTLPTKPDYYRQREGIAEPDPTWVPSASPSRLASKIHLLDKRHH
ncbi:hypothetical protein LZK76_33675 (plasmid) [Rhizobium leguminosarum]|nr:hypothetical protein LZK76_33675 [Rhizobium leguminosarum]